MLHNPMEMTTTLESEIKNFSNLILNSSRPNEANTSELEERKSIFESKEMLAKFERRMHYMERPSPDTSNRKCKMTEAVLITDQFSEK